jgi:hypothetical protein
MANEETTGDECKIKGNIIHWSSIKCKRVTRSVLASELYAMVHGVDIAIAINTTLKMITKEYEEAGNDSRHLPFRATMQTTGSTDDSYPCCDERIPPPPILASPTIES